MKAAARVPELKLLLHGTMAARLPYRHRRRTAVEPGGRPVGHAGTDNRIPLPALLPDQPGARDAAGLHMLMLHYLSRALAAPAPTV